jgi:hypothetical protein
MVEMMLPKENNTLDRDVNPVYDEICEYNVAKWLLEMGNNICLKNLSKLLFRWK